MINRLLGRNLRLITTENAIEICRKWSLRLDDYDLIIGIPRAGLFFASYLALRHNTKLSYPDQLISHNYPIKILIVEDSTNNMTHFDLFVPIVKTLNLSSKIDTGSLFVTENTCKKVDTFGEFRPDNCIFEWDLMDMHNAFSSRISTDLDGVICSDWPHGLTGDSSSHIESVRPYLIPKF